MKFISVLLFLTVISVAQPVRIGVIGSMVDSIGTVLLSAIDGLNVAVLEANMKGGVGGRQIVIVEANTNDDETRVPLLLDSIMSNASTRLDVLALTPGRAHIDVITAEAKKHNLLLVSPVSGDRQDFSKFDEHVAIFSPIPDAEVESLIRYLVLEKKLKRIALATTRDGVFGNDLIPYIEILLAEFGLEIVYQFVIDNPTKSYSDPTKSASLQLAEASLVQPQALLLLGYLYTVTGTFLAQYALTFYKQSYIAVPGLLFILAHQTFSMLPSDFVTEGYVVATQYSPLSTDTSYRFIRNMRASYEVAKPLLRSAIEDIDSDATISSFFSSGYLVGRTIVNVLSNIGANGIDSSSITKEFFSSRVFHVDDWQFGPFSNSSCEDSVSDTTCKCNAGGRRVLLSIMTKQLTLIPIPSSTIYFSLDQCIQSKSIQSPLIQLVGYPNLTQSAELNATIESFLAGDRAGYTNVSTSPSSRTGLISQLQYASTKDLEVAQADSLLTVATGGVYNSPITEMSANLTVILDPLFLTPQLYQGYVPRIIHLSATLDQEVHSLTSVYASSSITVLTTAEDSVNAMTNTLRKSVNTFGYTTFSVSSVSSIAAGLRIAQSGVIFIHGVSSEDDLTEVNAYLGRNTEAIIMIPFHHLSFWYNALLRAVTIPNRRERIVYATNIPDWNVTDAVAAKSPLLKSYSVAMKEAGLASPRSLCGFLTQRLVANIVERIPSKLTQETFLSTLFAVSVVVLDANYFTIGPLSNVACGGVTPVGNCEINIGARSMQIRSLSPSTESSEIGSFVFTSGVIDYRDLPLEKGVDTTIVVIASVAGFVLLIFAAVVISILLFSGRSHRCAPKDPEKPFTIIFTDIQSSTSLWAEVPEEMALSLEIHHRLIRALIKKHNGYEVKTIGDAFMIAFKYADDAVNLAFDLQHTFYACSEFPHAIDQAYVAFDKEKIMESAPESPHLSANLEPDQYHKVWSGLRVRVGIHTAYGDIKMDEVTKAYDYYGTVTNTAARVESVAHGGQVCLTDGTLQELTSTTITTFMSIAEVNTLESYPCYAIHMGPVELRGLADKVILYQLECIQGRRYPPLRLDNVPEDDLLEESLSSTVNTMSEHPASQTASGSVAPATAPQDLHSTQFMVSVATLFSSMPLQKRNKEVKKLCDLWRVRIDKKAIERAKTWTSTSLRARFGLRTVPEEAVNRCLAFLIAKEDPTLAVCLDALAKRVKVIAGKTLSNAVATLQQETDQVQIGKASHSRKESISLDLHSNGVRPLSEFLMAPVNFGFVARKSFDSGSPSGLVSPTSMVDNCNIISPRYDTVAKPYALQRTDNKTPLSMDEERQ